MVDCIFIDSNEKATDQYFKTGTSPAMTQAETRAYSAVDHPDFCLSAGTAHVYTRDQIWTFSSAVLRCSCSTGLVQMTFVLLTP